MTAAGTTASLKWATMTWPEKAISGVVAGAGAAAIIGSASELHHIAAHESVGYQVPLMVPFAIDGVALVSAGVRTMRPRDVHALLGMAFAGMASIALQVASIVAKLPPKVPGGKPPMDLVAVLEAMTMWTWISIAVHVLVVASALFAVHLGARMTFRYESVLEDAETTGELVSVPLGEDGQRGPTPSPPSPSGRKEPEETVTSPPAPLGVDELALADQVEAALEEAGENPSRRKVQPLAAKFRGSCSNDLAQRIADHLKAKREVVQSKL